MGSVCPSLRLSVRAHISESYWWIFIKFQNHYLYQHGIMHNHFFHVSGKIQYGRQTCSKKWFPDILRNLSLQITFKFYMMLYGGKIQAKFDFGLYQPKFKMAATH
jgi:hypothetical protein